MASMAPKDLSQLLAHIPVGHWVALSYDESKVLADGLDLTETLQRAKKTGEENPIVIKKWASHTPLVFTVAVLLPSV